MCRIIRMPPILDTWFQPLKGPLHWNHVACFGLWVVPMAYMWGRRHVAHVSRHLEAPCHRTRVNHFCWVDRWDPEAALRQKAQDLLRALSPSTGETVSWIIDDAKTAKRGRHMEAVAHMQDPTTDPSIQGHQDVCAIVLCRTSVIPCGLRLYVQKPPGAALGVPCRQTTA
jgi:hypothetical protein